jgi:hypothetical protein
MAGLVLELQSDAMNPSVRLVDLLRKARAVSVKLQTTDIEEWLGREMNGYEKAADVPDYRRLHADLKCFNPVRGLIPLAVANSDIQDIISSSPMTQSIGELEALVQSGGDGQGRVMRYFSPHQEHQLMQDMPHPMRPVQIIPVTAILAILESVRNRIFEWSLELEARGVLGDDLTFSKEEQERATQVTHNYTTNIGSITGPSQIQQGTTSSTQNLATGIDAEALTALVDSLVNQLDEMRLGDEQRAEMAAELATVRAQAVSSKPKAAIIKESLATIRHIMEASAAHFLVSHGPAIAALIARF